MQHGTMCHEYGPNHHCLAEATRDTETISTLDVKSTRGGASTKAANWNCVDTPQKMVNGWMVKHVDCRELLGDQTHVDHKPEHQCDES
eukprot:5602603-Amphidinium_carterae.1